MVYKFHHLDQCVAGLSHRSNAIETAGSRCRLTRHAAGQSSRLRAEVPRFGQKKILHNGVKSFLKEYSYFCVECVEYVYTKFSVDRYNEETFIQKVHQNGSKLNKIDQI